jgi:hypothetical protein
LDNVDYIQSFQYESPKLINGELVRETSFYSCNDNGGFAADERQDDIVYLSLNLGFLPPKGLKTYRVVPKKKAITRSRLSFKVLK